MMPNHAMQRTVTSGLCPPVAAVMAIVRRHPVRRETEVYLIVMDIPDAALFVRHLENIVRQQAAEPVEIVFVDDIARWCAERDGECRGNPIAMAIRDRSSGKAGILMRRRMEENAIREVIGRLEFGGFDVLAKRLTEPEYFLIQLALHEVVHLVNDWGQDREDDCDESAFRAMGWPNHALHRTVESGASLALSCR